MKYFIHKALEFQIQKLASDTHLPSH